MYTKLVCPYLLEWKGEWNMSIQYDFDKMIDRSHTQSLKWDCLPQKAPAHTLPLWVADMDFPCAQPIIEAIHARADRLIFGYSNYNSAEVKQAVVHWYQRRFEWNIDAVHMVFSPGAVPAIAFLLHSLTEPGDGVIIQRPVYYPFTGKIESSGRKVVNNALLYKDGAYTIDYDDLEQKMKEPHNKGIVLCNPHNPVGRVWNAQELRKIVAIARNYNKWIIADEIHSDLVRQGVEHQPLLKLCPEYQEQIIVCTAPSKTFNLAGLQMSNIIIPNEEYRRLWHRITNQEFSIAMANPLSLAAMMAAYQEGEDWLNQVNAYIDENIRFTQQFLQQALPKAHLVESQGTYLIWIDLRAYCNDAKELERMILEEAGVALDEGYIFGEEGIGFERINVACPRSILKACLERISKVLNR